VKNDGPIEGQPEPPLGPLPAMPADADPPLSGARQVVLGALQRRREPITLAALSQATSLHVNTLREHLDALESRGIVRRHRAAPNGRGRPAWLYEATHVSAAGAETEYAGLAAALAAAIHRNSSDPQADAIDAGAGWGRELAQAQGAPPRRGASSARHHVVRLLADLGFAPEANSAATSVRLTRCPLLEAAHRYPDVVCGVHLGIVQGALEAWDADSADTQLKPFSEPGACRLLLATLQRTAPTSS